MDEKRLFEQLGQESELIEPPKSLEPDAIEDLLKKVTVFDDTAASESQAKSSTNRKRRTRFAATWASVGVAAALVAVVGVNNYQSTLKGGESAELNREYEVAEPAAPADSENPEVLPQDDGFGVESYQVVYDTYKALEPKPDTSPHLFRKFSSGRSESIAATDAPMEAVDMAEAEAPAAEEEVGAPALKDASTLNGSGEFSQTNLQEIGVDEADIMKTDGDYVYVLNHNAHLSIVSAKGDTSEVLSTISVDDYSNSIQEFYVDHDTLSVIVCTWETDMTTEDDYYYLPMTTDSTEIRTYDISDRTNPQLTGTVTQTGTYNTSRKNGDYIYLFTYYYPNTADQDRPELYIPAINHKLIAEDSICIPDHVSSENCLVMSSVDIKNPDKTVDEKAILSAGYDYYVSPENIYTYQTHWTEKGQMTAFSKFSYEDGKIRYVATSAVPGYLHDRFSMNEYKNHLRVVVTTEDPMNDLYVFDSDMKVVGTIQDLAQGETIQSARFLGDTGYFVTFRNMDPLFSVDLSDPENPKILGELKITGFSSYLHFYSDSLLLGIGNEVDPETGLFKGIKLSMFDISDPANVQEVSKYVIKDTYDCPVLYDSKALMINPARNIFGMAVDNMYLVFSYDPEDGFVNEYTYQPFNHADDYDIANSNDMPMEAYIDTIENRACFSGDNLYLKWGDSLRVIDMMDDYRTVAKLDI